MKSKAFSLLAHFGQRGIFLDGNSLPQTLHFIKIFKFEIYLKLVKIVVKSSCVGCAFCKLSCKFDAIEVLYKAKIDYEKCVFCLKCVMYCPVDALVVE